MATTQTASTGKSAPTKGAKKNAIFVCETCRNQGLDARYSRIEYLHRHERTHTETKPFQCEYCSKRYARSDVLFRHRRKCSQFLQASGAPQPGGVEEPSAPSNSRSKAREETRPYPSHENELLPADFLTTLFGAAAANAAPLLPTAPFHPSRSGGTSPSSDNSSPPGSVKTPPQSVPLPLDSQFLSNQTYFETLNPRASNTLALYHSNLYPNHVSNYQETTNSSEKGSQNTLQGWSDQAIWDINPSDPFATEPTMLLVENNIFRDQCGSQGLDPSNPFYFDPTSLMLCYMVPKWNMPSVTRMSALAYRTFNSILEHLGVIHMPTFRLDESHNWLKFALCTTAPRPETAVRLAPMTNIGNSPIIQKALEEIDNTPEWPESQDMIRREKTDILVKSFYQTAKGRKLTAEESLPLIHALLLYNSTSFLSENQTDRLAGELYLATITSVARQSGLFNPGGECTKPAQSPVEDWEANWKKWITLESFRRTAWLVYTLDTLASLESNAVANVPPRDIRHIPLPYANVIWSAPTAEEWTHAMMNHHAAGLTLDDSMYCIAQVASASSKPLHQNVLGPYARLIMILTVLRGLVAYGQGQPKGGYVTRRWILRGEDTTQKLNREELHNHIITTYGRILDNWRQGWDLDMTCQPTHRGVYFVNDALPPYWLCRALLDKLTPLPEMSTSTIRTIEDDTEDGPNRLSDVNLREMLNVARSFVANGEGLGIAISSIVSPAPPSPVILNPFATFER